MEWKSHTQNSFWNYFCLHLQKHRYMMNFLLTSPNSWFGLDFGNGQVILEIRTGD